MKKIALFSALLMLLTACPIGLDYAPGTIGTEKVNSGLIGTWQFSATDESADHEILKVKFSKRDEYSFNVTVLEKGEMYSLETVDLVMYQTNIDGLDIMYFKPSDEDKYYLYQFELTDSKTLVTANISLLDGGTDAVISTQTLRDQIKASKGKDEFLLLEKSTFKRQ